MPFDTSIRDESVRAERSRREELRLRLIRDTSCALVEAANSAGIREAYLFGSLVRPGCFGDDSDVDVAITGARVSPLGLAAQLSRRIGREVHVIELGEDAVSDRAKREGLRWIPPS